MKVLRRIGQFKLNEGNLMAKGLYNVSNEILTMLTEDEGVSYWFDEETKDLLMRANDMEFIQRCKQMVGNDIVPHLDKIKASINYHAIPAPNKKFQVEITINGDVDSYVSVDDDSDETVELVRKEFIANLFAY